MHQTQSLCAECRIHPFHMAKELACHEAGRDRSAVPFHQRPALPPDTQSNIKDSAFNRINARA